MAFIETYKCNDCGLEFGVSKSLWEQPTCPDCGEHLNVVETTDEAFKPNSIEFETYRKCVRGEIDSI